MLVTIAFRLASERVTRTGGRAVECSGLENRRGLTTTRGSNPWPSAIPIPETQYLCGFQSKSENPTYVSTYVPDSEQFALRE